MKAVSSLQGIDSISMDMKDMKLTVIGMVDPIDVVGKLRKHWCADMVSVGPAKEPEKKEEPKKGKRRRKRILMNRSQSSSRHIRLTILV
ncbi:heavy metal-associated domain containing protein [Musa troglodytarum]|nr:heavy metal-associated domain containing protein [Musa troglodytarum]